MDGLHSKEECRLLVGPTALGIQGLLISTAAVSLLVKRSIESPKRPLLIWSLDVSKQGLGMLAAHICGMAAAIILAHVPIGHRSSECAWYIFTFMLDTCIGTGLSLLLHWLATKGAARLPDSSLLSLLVPCGKYGDPPSWTRWAAQALEWVLCVILARGVCLGLAAALAPLLQQIAVRLDALFEGHPTLFLVFVMLLCPLITNVIQVLVQDAFLRWRSVEHADEDEEIPFTLPKRSGTDTSPPSSAQSNASEVQMMLI